MSWDQYVLFAVFGLYTLAVLIIAPYLTRKAKQRKSPIIRERRRQLLLQLRWSLFVIILLCVGNAVAFFPITLLGSSFFISLGLFLLIGAFVFLLLWFYLARLISSLEKE